MNRYEVTSRGELLIDGSLVALPHPVKDAVGVHDFVVVLFDPDTDPRRYGTFPNLVAIDRGGRQIWTAETPTSSTGDRYYRIESAEPLVALSTQSYDCELDPATGRIVRRVFTK